MAKSLEHYKKWVISFRQENYKWQDSQYLPRVTYGHWAKWLALGILCEGVLVYFFYRNIWGALALCWIPIVITYVQWRSWKIQMLLQIEDGFKEWIYYIKSGLQAGKSIENAMLCCRESFYSNVGEGHPVVLGVEQVYHGLSLHIPTEECITKLATETGVETIRDFAAVFQIVKRQGGRMMEILDKTITQIGEKIELREELYALFAAKKMEQRIMSAIPFAIMLFVGGASRGYFDSLYNTFQGVCIMTVCLFVYLISVWWGEKLTEVSF